MLSGLMLSALVLAPAADPGPLPPALQSPAAQAQPGAAAVAPDTPAAPVTPQPMTPGPYPTDGMAGPVGQSPAQPSLADNHLGPPYSFWASADYRMYWLKPAPLSAPLLATGSGATLIGGKDVEYGRTNGGGWEVGTWLDNRHTFGLAGGGFLTEQRSVFAAANSTGSPALFRPITDVVLAGPSQAFVAAPGTLAGSFWTQQTARVAGADVYGIRNLAYCPNYSFDFLAGFRYFDLEESLDVNQVSRPVGGTVLSFLGAPNPAITAVALNDHFRTRNQWWGGQLGLRGEYRLGPAFLNLVTKVGLGDNHQVVEIDGSTRAAGIPGGAAPGGLLAVQGGNIGRFSTHRFSVLSEVGATVGVQVSQAVRVFAGYDFFYLNNVVRPGQQVDPVVNTRLVPISANFGGLSGIRSPVVTGVRDDFFVHGLRLGAELRY